MNNSKKILCVLLCGLVMAGCAVNKNDEKETEEVTEQVSETTEISETTAAETTIAETSEETFIYETEPDNYRKKVTFINKKEPEKAIVFKGEGRKFSVFKNGDKVAEVTADHEVEAEPEVRYEDFNFDGYKDLFLFDPSTDFRHYGGECWLWNEQTKSYEETDKLDGLFGFGIDTEFSDKRIKLTYTEHFNYSVSYICNAELEWKNGEIVPVSLEKSVKGLDRTYIEEKEHSAFIRDCVLNEVYEFNGNNEPVLKTRTYALENADDGINTVNGENLNYFRAASDSVKYMNGDTVIQIIPLNNADDLVSRYRMKKHRNSYYPLYFNDLVFSMDYDYDGYTDLCITTGVNDYGFADKFIYYHYDPDTGMFSEWDELNNTFDGAWIYSEESHRFSIGEKYEDIKTKEKYSKLSYDKFTPSGSGQYCETVWYEWKDNRLEPDSTEVSDVNTDRKRGSVSPLSISGAYLNFNAPKDGDKISGTGRSPVTAVNSDGSEIVPFYDTPGLPAAESADTLKYKRGDSGYSYYNSPVSEAVSEIDYVPKGYSHEISDHKLIIKTPQISQTITDCNCVDSDKVVYADFNFDDYVDFYTCSRDCKSGFYYLWNPVTKAFERNEELEFYKSGESSVTVKSYFLKPDYNTKTLTAVFDDYSDDRIESITLRWEGNKLVPVSAVLRQYSWVSDYRIIKKCCYKYDENKELILTGTEETVYEKCSTIFAPLVYRKNEFDNGGDEKYFRFTDNELQVMRGNSIVQSLSLGEYLEDETEHNIENIMPGDKFTANKADYAEWDIDFDGYDDLCIFVNKKYSYYLFDKSSGMYRKWDSLSEKGWLYLPDYKEKTLYYKTMLYNSDEDIDVYNYHKWENEQDVIYKQKIVNIRTDEIEWKYN